MSGMDLPMRRGLKDVGSSRLCRLLSHRKIRIAPMMIPKAPNTMPTMAPVAMRDVEPVCSMGLPSESVPKPFPTPRPPAEDDGEGLLALGPALGTPLVMDCSAVVPTAVGIGPSLVVSSSILLEGDKGLGLPLDVVWVLFEDTEEDVSGASDVGTWLVEVPAGVGAGAPTTGVVSG
jgi:hypothetical protein